jgi:heat shock protein HslJ
MRLTVIAALGALAIVVAACSGGGSAGTGGTIEGTRWVLTSYQGENASVPVPDGVIVDATFADGKVAGSGGCNRYTGPATVDGATLKVGPLASTQMACDDPAGATETAFLAAFQNAASFTATDATLTVYNASGASTLVFEAGPANPLLGEWNVTGFNNGQEAVVSPAQGTELTATFTADAVSGSSGCNTYNGGYTLEGSAVTIGPLASTMMACDQPIMDQEAQFQAALQAATTVESSGGTVTLRDASGAMQVTLASK